ncbi:MAG TPA: hypothetical protein VFC72_03415, partial [Corynebacterium sp.]|nr:hypothetical protein [Corynebacterium sp.]
PKRAPDQSPPSWFAPLPGAALCLFGTLAALWTGSLLPAFSPPAAAFLLGGALAVILPAREVSAPGLRLSAGAAGLGTVILSLSVLPVLPLLPGGDGFAPTMAQLLIAAGSAEAPLPPGAVPVLTAGIFALGWRVRFAGSAGSLRGEEDRQGDRHDGDKE